MRKFLAFLFLLGSIGGVYAQAGPPPTGPAYSFPCNASVASSFTATANASQVVAPIIGRNIYVCGWHASTLNTTSTSQTTFQLSFTNVTSNPGCATTTPSIPVTPFNGVTSTAPSVDHQTVASFAGPVPVGGLSGTNSPSSLCLNVNGTPANLQIIIYYGQY